MLNRESDKSTRFVGNEILEVNFAEFELRWTDFSLFVANFEDINLITLADVVSPKSD